MIYYKTEEEIELIKESSLLVGKTLAELAKIIKPGVTTLQLDRIAHDFIRDNGGVPAFLNYEGFPNTLCVSVNAQVVHGIPGNNELKEGDLVSIDCGVVKNEFFGDSAYSFAVGEVSAEVQKLMRVTKESLYKGIEKAVSGMRIGDISAAGCFGANGYGLHDMLGTVWEWTRSVWGNYPYPTGDPNREDPDAADDARRVVRGGSWPVPGGSARCAFRDWVHPGARGNDLGFRVVLRSASILKS